MSSFPRRPPHPSGRAEPPVVSLDDLPEARALYAQLDPAWFDEANDPHAWLFEPEVQRLIAEVVDQEIAPFAALLSPENLRALREEMVVACHVDPVSIEYLDRIRPRPEQDGSGKIRKGERAGKPAVVVAFPHKKAGGGRP